jgi:Restriction endonuclease XhoI
MTKLIDNLESLISDAVAHYWQTRAAQREKQKNRGVSDAGLRSAVTGGAQMDGIIRLFTEIIVDAGLDERYVFRKKRLELPGFFRPTKEWDLLVIKEGHLLAAIETKSQVGPSFGNNFNNRTEEAMGSSLDLWTAFREGAFNGGIQPFLGYFFMLEDCRASTRPVRVKEPHFKVFPEFVGASYMKRYELFCRKLVLERHYTSASFITSDSDTGLEGLYREPAKDLSFSIFVKSLVSHVGVFA